MGRIRVELYLITLSSLCLLSFGCAAREDNKSASSSNSEEPIEKLEKDEESSVLEVTKEEKEKLKASKEHLIKCPPGTELTGDEPPNDYVLFCQKQNDDGSHTRHGPYISWYTQAWYNKSKDPSKKAEGNYNIAFFGCVQQNFKCDLKPPVAGFPVFCSFHIHIS